MKRDRQFHRADPLRLLFTSIHFYSGREISPANLRQLLRYSLPYLETNYEIASPMGLSSNWGTCSFSCLTSVAFEEITPPTMSLYLLCRLSFTDCEKVERETQGKVLNGKKCTEV